MWGGPPFLDESEKKGRGWREVSSRMGIAGVPLPRALPPMILERYDSIEVRGWGSANDMIPEELGSGPGRRLRRELISTSGRRALVKEDGEIADKGRRSFLRRAERLGEV